MKAVKAGQEGPWRPRIKEPLPHEVIEAPRAHVENHTKTSCGAIVGAVAAETGVKISRSSAWRILRFSLGKKAFKRVRGQNLSPANIEARKDWATAICVRLALRGRFLFKTTALDLGAICFTDEKIFTCAAADDESHVWVDATLPDGSPVKKARVDDEAITRKTTHFMPSIMVSGGISSKGLFPPHFADRSVKINTDKYIEILDDFILPQARAQFPGGGWWLQQDNAPSHASKRTQQHLRDEHVRTIPWPANSPNMNPMDFAVWSRWAFLAAKRQPKTEPELRAAIVSAHAELAADPDYITNTIGQFKKRCFQLRAAQGKHFEHKM